jgi:AcrR family transcriptional regulator
MARTDEAAALITPRRAATRQRLLTAAAGIFAERGMHGATVEDICEAAGFSRGAFYSNFADKEELFSALLRQQEEELLAQINQVLDADAATGTAQSVDGADLIEQLVDKVLAALPMDRQSHLVHAEFALHAIRNPAAARQLTEEGQRFRLELARLLQAGLARAGRHLTVDPADAVVLVISAFEVSTEQTLLRDSADQPDPGLARRTLPLIIRALSEPDSPR